MGVKAIETENAIITLDIPDDFVKLSEEEMSKIMINDPFVTVLRDPERGYMVTVCDKELDNDTDVNIETALNAFHTLYQRVLPGYSDASFMKREINGNVFGAIQFKSTSLNEDFYNLLFVTIVDKVEVLVSVRCQVWQFAKAINKFMGLINNSKVVKKPNAKTA